MYGTHAQRDDLHWLRWTRIPVALIMRAVKGSQRVSKAVRHRHRQLKGLPTVADVQRRQQPGARWGLVSRLLQQGGEKQGQGRLIQAICQLQDAPPIVARLVGERHAEGRQDARITRDQYGADAETVRQFTGVHRPGAAERNERDVAWIVALLHGDVGQGAGHAGVDDANDAGRGRLHAQPRESAQAFQGCCCMLAVQRHFAAEQPGRSQATQQQVGIGDGRFTAAAVAGRARFSPGRGRANTQQPTGIEPSNGAASSADSMYSDHRLANGPPGQTAFDHHGDAAVAKGHIRRRTTHIQADQPRRSRPTHRESAGHAPSWTREGQADRVARRRFWRGQAAGALHELDVGRDLTQALQVAGGDRSTEGVDHRRAGPLVLAELRRDVR